MYRALACLLLLATSSCLTNSVGYREQCMDPDVRLARLLEDYDRSKDPAGPYCGCWPDWDANDWKPCPDSGHILVDPDRVWNRIEELAFEFPRHEPTLLANAMIAYEEGERIKSQRYLDQILSLVKVHPDAAVLRSRLAVEDGNLKTARKLLDDHIRHVPNHAGLHEALAGIHFLEGMYEDAQSEIAVAEELGAPTWRMAFNLGLIAETQGELRQAAEFYQSAYDLNPQMETALARLQGVNARLYRSR